MPNGERPWEGATRRDGEISQSAGAAIGLAFLMTVAICLVVVGFSLVGLLVGGAVGTVVIVLLAKLVARSDRGTSDGPPPQLL